MLRVVSSRPAVNWPISKNGTNHNCRFDGPPQSWLPCSPCMNLEAPASTAQSLEHDELHTHSTEFDEGWKDGSDWEFVDLAPEFERNFEVPFDSQPLEWFDLDIVTRDLIDWNNDNDGANLLAAAFWPPNASLGLDSRPASRHRSRSSSPSLVASPSSQSREASISPHETEAPLRSHMVRSGQPLPLPPLLSSVSRCPECSLEFASRNELAYVQSSYTRKRVVD